MRLRKLTLSLQPDQWILYALIAASLAAFYFANSIVDVTRPMTSIRLLTSVAVIFAGLALVSASLPKGFLVILQSINLCCVLYLAGMHSTYTLGITGPLDSVWLPVMVGLLGFRWPALVALPALAIKWFKLQVQTETGLGAPNSADFIIIPDLALFLAITISVYTIYLWLYPRLKTPEIGKEAYFNAVVIIAAAIHLSNYFHSGWEKMFLADGTILTWMLENPTYYLAIHSTDAGALTILGLLPDPDALIPALTWLNVPLNAWVLLIQLIALASLLSLRGSAWLTFLYDVMHVGIFLLTGIFFWKWIILNAAFIYAFRHMQPSHIPCFGIRIFGCVIVVIAPLLSFHIVKLAWFDTGGVNDAYFELETKQGETLRAPSNFFLDKSINVAQQRIVRPTNGFLPTGTWGTTSRGSVLRAMEDNCAATKLEWGLSDEQKVKLEQMVWQHQALMLSLADAEGRVAYDFYPHHIWSAPWHFDAVAQLDVRQIRSYVFVVESRCVSVGEDGTVSRQSVGQYRYEIDL